MKACEPIGSLVPQVLGQCDSELSKTTADTVLKSVNSNKAKMHSYRCTSALNFYATS